ncbi:hypothetical protein D7X87_17910 [bacterium D16-54]|nr:hypothetical protein D7X87_17910 [bacterium D16-54]RKJ12702.1 hypothetical protein D7X65_18355 [bacterium D16-56]
MKKIVYTQRVEIIESYQERRDCADQRIAQFITACGFLPVPLPNRARSAEKFIRNLLPSGMILTGGNSLVKYGGNAPERDCMDAELIRIAVTKKIPLYGFCRGMQSILDFFGEDLADVEGHIGVRTILYGRTDSQLGNFNREVNSYHKQACLQVRNAELEVLAKSADGVVKAVRHKKYPILGTMWHPERESPFAEADIQMLHSLLGEEGEGADETDCRID